MRRLFNNRKPINYYESVNEFNNISYPKGHTKRREKDLKDVEKHIENSRLAGYLFNNETTSKAMFNQMEKYLNLTGEDFYTALKYEEMNDELPQKATKTITKRVKI